MRHFGVSENQGYRAFLEVTDPEGRLEVIQLERPITWQGNPSLPFRYAWEDRKHRIDLREMGVGLGQTSSLQAGEETVFLDHRVCFEDRESVLRLGRGALDQHRSERLAWFDRHLAPCADRSRILAGWFEGRGITLTAAFYYQRAVTADNANESHYLAALAFYDRNRREELVNMLLTEAAVRFPKTRALDHWAEARLARQRRFHHLTQLRATSELSMLEEEAIHEYRQPPFRIRFPATLRRELLHFCLETSARAHGQLRRWARFPDEVVITIDRWENALDNLAMGYFDGREIHLNAAYFADGQQGDQFQAVLKHELIHLLAHHEAACQDLVLPRWLDEGIAYFITEQWDHIPAAIPLETVEALLADPSHPDYPSACRQAAQWVSRLIGEAGLIPGGLAAVIAAGMGMAEDL